MCAATTYQAMHTPVSPYRLPFDQTAKARRQHEDWLGTAVAEIVDAEAKRKEEEIIQVRHRREAREAHGSVSVRRIAESN